jgi:hypothetical protein
MVDLLLDGLEADEEAMVANVAAEVSHSALVA